MEGENDELNSLFASCPVKSIDNSRDRERTGIYTCTSTDRGHILVKKPMKTKSHNKPVFNHYVDYRSLRGIVTFSTLKQGFDIKELKGKINLLNPTSMLNYL